MGLDDTEVDAWVEEEVEEAGRLPELGRLRGAGPRPGQVVLVVQLLVELVLLLEFDDVGMTYEGALSSYSPAPFDVHIQGTSSAEVAAGEIRLDGNTFGSGASGDRASGGGSRWRSSATRRTSSWTSSRWAAA